MVNYGFFKGQCGLKAKIQREWLSFSWGWIVSTGHPGILARELEHVWPLFADPPKTRPQLPCGPYQGDDEDENFFAS